MGRSVQIGRFAAAAFVIALLVSTSGAAGAEPAAIHSQVAAAKAAQSWIPGSGMSPYGDYLAARHAENTHDPLLASRLYERILERSPDDPSLLRQTLHQMVAAGRMKEAKEIAKRYLKFRSNSVIAGLVLAIEHIRARRYPEAASRLKAIPKRGIGGYFVPLALAWTLAGEGKPVAALKALAPFGKRQGLKNIHDLHVALIYDMTGRNARATSMFDPIAKQADLHRRVLELTGAFYERQGKPGKARVLYEKFLTRERNAIPIESALARVKAGRPAPAKEIGNVTEGVAEALWNLATLLNEQNVQEVALMLTRMALHLRPKFALAQILLGDILEGMRRYEDAVAAYDLVNPASPRKWSARLRAADTLSRMEETVPALDRLAVMADEKPARSEALIARGDIQRFKKRYEDSIEAYDGALKRIGKIEPHHWSLYYSRGVSLERAKRWPQAEKDFLTALKLYPDQPLVLNYLGYSWVEKRQHLERALAMIAKAVRLKPRDGYILDSLGWAHYQLGNFKRAVLHLEHAIMLSPEDSAINDHLGDAYWRVGRRTEARFQWRRALGLDPEKEEIAGIRKKLEDGLTKAPPKRSAKGGKPGKRGG